jgi:hypothetical protein
MRMAQYWEAQEQKWHERYLETEKMLGEVEQALSKVESISLVHIDDPEVCAQIRKIVDDVWRGARK